MNVNLITIEARREIAEEQFRAAVEARKQELRVPRPWWQRLFPFVITIHRRP
jgi:hypothetical protein